MQGLATKSPSVFSSCSTSSPLPSTKATLATGSSGSSQLLFSDEEEDGEIISVDVNSEHAFEIAVVTSPVRPAVTATDEAAGTSSASVCPAVTATDEAAGTSSGPFLVEKSGRKCKSNTQWGSHKRPTRQNTRLPEWSRELNSTNPLQK